MAHKIQPIEEEVNKLARYLKGKSWIKEATVDNPVRHLRIYLADLEFFYVNISSVRGSISIKCTPNIWVLEGTVGKVINQLEEYKNRLVELQDKIEKYCDRSQLTN